MVTADTVVLDELICPLEADQEARLNFYLVPGPDVPAGQPLPFSLVVTLPAQELPDMPTSSGRITYQLMVSVIDDAEGNSSEAGPGAAAASHDGVLGASNPDVNSWDRDPRHPAAVSRGAPGLPALAMLVGLFAAAGVRRR